MDNFEGENQLFIYILFILATFMTQVTVLNMLIAIMGNTFDCVKEQQARSKAEMKIKILADYIKSIKTKKTLVEKKSFIVLCTLDQIDDL